MAGFPRDERDESSHLQLELVHQFTTHRELVAQGETAPPASNFPPSLEIRAHAKMEERKPLLHTAARTKRAAPECICGGGGDSERATDALKADFTTFLRVHFVCRNDDPRLRRRRRRQSFRRGIRVGNGRNARLNAENCLRSLRPSSVVLCDSANPSLFIPTKDLLPAFTINDDDLGCKTKRAAIAASIVRPSHAEAKTVVLGLESLAS